MKLMWLRFISYALTGSMTRALGPKLVPRLSTSNSTRRSPVVGSNTPISRVHGSAQYNFSLIQSQATPPEMIVFRLCQLVQEIP